MIALQKSDSLYSGDNDESTAAILMPPDQTESPNPTENLDIHTLTVTYYAIWYSTRQNVNVLSNNWRIKKQLDAIYYFIVLLIGSTCFGHYYAHHQELATMMLITTLVVSFCKDIKL